MLPARALVKVDGAIHSVWSRWAARDVTVYAGVPTDGATIVSTRGKSHRMRRRGA
jgi:hypothetical protein